MADDVLVLDAELVGSHGVRRSLAVRSDQRLVEVHHILQEAFGWENDHLYSFWLSDRAFDGDAPEYTAPVDVEPGMATAEVAIAELGLDADQRFTYVFDFGDHWEVHLRVTGRVPADDGEYPRILEIVGEAPPQYEDFEV